MKGRFLEKVVVHHTASRKSLYLKCENLVPLVGPKSQGLFRQETARSRSLSFGLPSTRKPSGEALSREQYAPVEPCMGERDHTKTSEVVSYAIIMLEQCEEESVPSTRVEACIFTCRRTARILARYRYCVYEDTGFVQ